MNRESQLTLCVWHGVLSALAIYAWIKRGDDIGLFVAALCGLNAWVYWREWRCAR